MLKNNYSDSPVFAVTFHYVKIAPVTQKINFTAFNGFPYSTVGFIKMKTVMIPAVFGNPEYFRKEVIDFISLHINYAETSYSGCVYNKATKRHRMHFRESRNMLALLMIIRYLCCPEPEFRIQRIQQ